MNLFRSIVPALLFLFILLSILPPPLAAQDSDRASEAYFSANALYNRKLYPLAIEEYSTFLNNYPRHEKAQQARFGLALCYNALGDRKRAEPLFARLASDGKLVNQQEVHNLWGHCLLALDRLKDAEAAYAFSVDRGRDAAQATIGLVGLIESRYRQSKWKEVIRSCDLFLKKSPDPEYMQRVKFQAAVARFELAMFKEASQLLRSLLDERDRSPLMQHITFLLAESCRELGQTDQAEKYLHMAARRMNGAFTAEALFRLAFLRFQAGKFIDAAVDFTELISEHGASPHTVSAGIYLGRCCIELEDHRQAEKIFLSFSEKSPEYGTARLWLARSHLRRNNPARAERVLAQTLERVSRSPVRLDLLNKQGNVLMEQGKYEAASRSFAALAAEFPKSPLAVDALWLEACCLHREGEFERSAGCCDAFLKKNPRSERYPDLLFLKAENLFLAARGAEAELLYTRFVSRFPDHFYTDSARFRIAQVLYDGKKWRSARKALEALLPAVPDKPFFNQFHFLRGDCFFNTQEWDKAIESFTLFHGKHPGEANSDVAAFKAALAMERKGDAGAAASALGSFLTRFPRSDYLPEVRVELGRLLYEQGNLEEARRVLTRSGRHGDSAHAAYTLGCIAMAEENNEAALSHFNAVTTRFPQHALAPDALLQQAVLNIHRERYRESQKSLESFLGSNARHEKADEALFYLGVALARREKWDEASAHFRELLDNHAASTFRDRAFYEWIWCEKSNGKPERAAKLYASFLKEFPASSLVPEVTFELAELEYGSGSHDAAARRLEGLLGTNLEPGLRERALYRLGWNRFSQGRMAEAASSFEKVIKEFPESPRIAIALYQAGDARLKLKEHETAYLHFKKLEDLGRADENAEQSLLRLGECAALTQRWAEAEKVHRSFADRYPKSPFLGRALFGRGWALENQKRYTEAIEAYSIVLKRGETNETTARCQFQIGECRFSLGQYDEAVKALIKVEVLYSYPKWSAKALLETARALERPGKIEKARAQYEELIRKYPESDAAVVARKRLKNLDKG